MTFATHVALFGAVNSGLWFYQQLHRWQSLPLPWLTLLWLAALLGHGVYVFAIADYSEPLS
jgi:hypothetical protein